MLKSTRNCGKPLVLGILGGGQLAKMLDSDAYRMGINVAIIDKESGTPAGDMTKAEFPGGWGNPEALAEFIEASDIITLENEFIDPEILERIAKERPLYPSPATMRLVQDKYIQKQTFSSRGIPVPAFEAIESTGAARAFGQKHGYPFVLKARRNGYDGYGNALVESEAGIESARAGLTGGSEGRALYAEEFVDFSMELAVMAARGRDGKMKAYPCVETVQQDHICHKVIAPARIEHAWAEKARQIAMECVESIEGVGVFGVEMFLTRDGGILVNEIAPRPHNSGHYTIEACYTSQYENCIRAVCGLPLGSTDMITGGAAMINLLGRRGGPGTPSDIVPLLSNDRVRLHLYNKKVSREGRKMGHLTALGATPQDALATAEKAAADMVW